MSRLKKASVPPAYQAFSAAFTIVNREEVLDCLTAYYNGTSVDISSPFFHALGYARFNGIERLAAALLLEGEGWFGAFGVRTPRVRGEKPSVPMIAAEFVRRYMKIAENCLRPQFGFSLKDLRTKLEKPKVKRRLQAIQQRWSDWPKILEMIKTIGETAQVSKGSKYEATRRV